MLGEVRSAVKLVPMLDKLVLCHVTAVRTYTPVFASRFLGAPWKQNCAVFSTFGDKHRSERARLRPQRTFFNKQEIFHAVI